MASTTPNIGLTLPTGAEKVSRQIINDNNTIIDGKMGAVPGGQNLQGEIDALNSKIGTVPSGQTVEGQISSINGRLEYITLLNGETVTSTSTNKTLYNGRKLSDYKLILAIIKRSNSYRASMMIPIGLFKTSTATLLFEVDSINTQRWYNIVYIDDTTVAIQCSENANSDGIIYLYGVL